MFARSTPEADLITLSSAMFTEVINVQTMLQQLLERPFQSVLLVTRQNFAMHPEFHIWRMSLPGLASIYQRFHTAPYVRCPAL